MWNVFTTEKIFTRMRNVYMWCPQTGCHKEKKTKSRNIYCKGDLVEKWTINSKPNLIPVRGKNGSLIVKSISFSSSIKMGKLMPTCPRRKYKKGQMIAQNET